MVDMVSKGGNMITVKARIVEIYGELAYLTDAITRLGPDLSSEVSRRDGSLKPRLIARNAVVSLYHYHRAIGVLLEELQHFEPIDSINGGTYAGSPLGD